jgi:hypothetical protein
MSRVTVSFPSDPTAKCKTISQRVARGCNTIANILEDLGNDCDSDEAIPLPGVKVGIFLLLEEWYDSGNCRWSIKRIQEFADLVMAANFLDAKELLEELIKVWHQFLVQWTPPYGQLKEKLEEIKALQSTYPFMANIAVPSFFFT